LGGPLHTQDAGNNAQNLFHAPLGLVHKQTSSLIQILATFENGKNYSIRFEILNNSSIFDSIQNAKALFAHH